MEGTLLLVDDEPNVIQALKRLLRPDGYQIITATSGAKGLAIINQHKADVIISDQRMPLMSGVEFLTQVRQHSPNTVRIVLSAYSDFGAVTSAINDGAIYKFFTKPWDDKQMRANVREAFVHSALTQKNEQLTRIFESTLEGIMITDVNGVIQSVNPAFTFITGYNSVEAVGKTPRLLRSDRHEPEFYQVMWAKLSETGQWQGEIWNKRKNGDIYPLWLALTAITNADDQVGQYVGLFNDITEQKKNESRIRHQAYHDALTGLPNRLLFNDRLVLGLAQARRSKEKLAIMFIDLDRFKTINDSLGHSVGDLLLQGMSHRLIDCTREEDTVARMGGDEFMVILPRIKQLQDVKQVAAKILDSFRKPLLIEGHELVVTTSIGISLFPGDGATPDILMKNADSAMYKAKDKGKNKYQFFCADMGVSAMQRLTWETQLHRALEREEFELHYQPQVNASSGHLLGFEVLVRWQHPDLGLVPPGKFIHLLEETGLIVPVGEWILDQACRQNQSWREAGLPPVRVAVNYSGRQFRDIDLDIQVDKILQNSGLPASGLGVEITESVVMDNVEQSTQTLHRLHAKGIHISIDDFGTGYSSFSYLKQFPIDSMKIDQSFVRDITCNPQDREIVNSIITMAHGLNLQTIAEGVETWEQLSLLKTLGCDEIQGFFISKPVPATEARKLLQYHRDIPLVQPNSAES